MAITPLDPSQKHALESIVSDTSSDISVVHGPPGTGKSQLLVSLLFELASSGKTVLFVSQNTEALEVIGRKIDDVEKIMKIADDHISFKDFCLKIYQKEHRTLKHISRQYSRLGAKTVPSFDKSALRQEESSVRYPLSFTHLDRAENHQLESNVIGTDELLAYYLKYVSAPMVGVPVRRLEDIDIRAVMQHIETFEDGYNTFSQHNHPQNALRFISRDKTTITLNDIRSHGLDIDTIVAKIPDTAKAIRIKEETDINQLLIALSSYAEISPYIHLRNMQIDNYSVVTLRERLLSIVESSQKLLPNSEQLVGVEQTDDIFPDTAVHAHITNSTIDDFSRTISELVVCCDEMTKIISSVGNSTISDVIDASLRTISLDIDPLLKQVPELGTLEAKDITALLESIAEWENLSSIKKMLKKYPEQYEQLLPESKDQTLLGLVRANTSVLSTLQTILEGTTVTIGLYNKIYNSAHRQPLAFNLTANSSVEELLPLVNLAIKAKLYAGKYEIDRLLTIAKIQTSYRSVLTDIDLYRSIVAQNESLYRLDSAQIVPHINKTIESNRVSSLIAQIVPEISSYIGATDANEAIAKAKVINDTLQDFVPAAKQTIDLLDLPNTEAQFPVGDINQLSTTLSAIAALDTYNEHYWLLTTGASVQSWHDTIKSLNTYNNINEFNAFMHQHEFLRNLKKLLGENEKWIDERIADDSIDYPRFRERIVNDLVRACVDGLGYAERRQIEDSFFNDYNAWLSIRRRAHYLAGLRNMWHSSNDGAKNIANTNNWSFAASVMDKIRKNTDLITKTYPIVLATPKEVAKYISANQEVFDYVLFDEASQLLPGQAIPSIYRARKAVIVGDPHQMPPSLNAAIGGSMDEPDDFEEAGDSILDLAISLQTIDQHHLKVHYRSESNKLFEPSRAAIYSNDGIQPIIEAYSGERTPIAISDDLGDDEQKNFGTIVKSIVERLATEPSATFCILFTRLDIQNDFKDFLASNESAYKNVFDLYEENGILISTVTNCQGIEADYSILYLNHYSSPAAMWFFNEKGGAYKRLNVAITRQRKGLEIIMANPRSLWLSTCDRFISGHNSQPNTRKSALLLQALLRNAGEAVDAAYLDRKLGDNSLSIDSPLTEQLYTMLEDHYRPHLGSEIKFYCEVGWQLLIPNKDNIAENQRNVGFRIDIGVYSTEAESFVLGIEMDGAAYHSGFDKEHSDNLREQVLRSKGWEIYRIWSTNWLNDTISEFRKLTEKIDYQLENTEKPVQSEPVIITLASDVNDDIAASEDDEEPIDSMSASATQLSILDGSSVTATEADEVAAQQYVISLDDYRNLNILRQQNHTVLSEEVTINGREPMIRCELTIPDDSVSAFATSLTFALTSANVHKEVNAAAYRIMIDTPGDDAVRISVLYNDESEPSPGNSFQCNKIAIQKLKDILQPASHNNPYRKTVS